MNHIRIDFYFVRDFVTSGVLHVTLVTSANQFADLLTHSLPGSTFVLLCSKIGVFDRPSILRGHIKDISFDCKYFYIWLDISLGYFCNLLECTYMCVFL